MASSAYNNRPGRESVSKRIGEKATAWIWRRDCCRCVYCGADLTPGRGAHLDHLEPRARGGEDLVVNLVLSCDSCNSARQDMSLEQWAAYAQAARKVRFSPEDVRAIASTPCPAELAGRGRAWTGCPISRGGSHDPKKRFAHRRPALLA
jgi:hypothetical protein